MGAVAKSAVTVVAYLKAVFIVLSGTMCGPLHITKLDFINPVFRIHINRKYRLQKPVQFPPVDLRFEFQPSAVRTQPDILGIERAADSSFYPQHGLQAFRQDLRGYVGRRFHLLIHIVGINIPGIEHTRHILVHAEPVHGRGSKFSAGSLQNKAGNFTVPIDLCSYQGIFHTIPVLRHGN